MVFDDHPMHVGPPTQIPYIIYNIVYRPLTLKESLSITTLHCNLAIVTHAKENAVLCIFMHFPSMSRNGQVATEVCIGHAFF